MATLNLQTLLDAIENSKTEMMTHINAKVDPIQASLANIQNSLQTLGDQVEHLEVRVSTNQDNIVDLTDRVKALELEVTHLGIRLNMQNRGRGCPTYASLELLNMQKIRHRCCPVHVPVNS